MRNVRMWGAGVVLLALGAAGGYAVGAAGSRVTGGGDGGPVVATFEGGSIDLGTVRARIQAEGPLVAETYATPAGRRELVERMAREQLLLSEARKRGIDRQPAVTRQCEGAVLEAYLEEAFETPERERPLTQDELEAAFKAQKDAFSHPAQARVAQLFLAAPASDAASRAEKRKAAVALLAEARSAFARSPDAFTTLVRRRSEDARTRALGGELPLMSQVQLAQTLGADAAKGVFEGSAAAGVVDKVLESDDGFRLVAVLERLPASEPTLEEVRPVLEPRARRERRKKAYEAFIAALEKQAHVKIDEAQLTALDATASDATR